MTLHKVKTLHCRNLVTEMREAIEILREGNVLQKLTCDKEALPSVNVFLLAF